MSTIAADVISERPIHSVSMSRNHFQIGDRARIRMVVLHATAGRSPGDYEWLRQGGSVNAPVSIHYYIDKGGMISQMVDDANIAWHAGQSTWVVDGQQIPYAHGCNAVSVGIELENWNDGADPYPQEQYDAALWLTRQLVQTYDIPRSQLVRHLDIAPQRKTDPRAFPWVQFVEEVYSPLDGAANPAEQLARLRARLVDLAYRAANSSCPDGWPLLRTTISRDTGMPVLALAPQQAHNDPDAHERAIEIGGRTLVVEAYGRDVLFAPPDQLIQVERLTQTKPGTLHTALLEAIFRAVDPTHGFQPEWAFHQYYLEHATELGVPITPSYRLANTTSDGTTYVVQHFSLDSLCAPVGNWQQITRLSSLTSEMYGGDPHSPAQRELRNLLLNDLYQQRTGTSFDATALFCQYALKHQLGAPLASAELLTFNGRRLVAMAYALDVIYCQVPADANWERVQVNDLPPVLGSAPEYVGRLTALLREPGEAVLGQLSAAPTVPPTYPAHLLGKPVQKLLERDLTIHNSPLASSDTNGSNGSSSTNGNSHPERLVLVPVVHGLPSIATRTDWHAYLDRRGVLTRLARHLDHSHFPAHAHVVAIEGGTRNMPPAQRRALLLLVRHATQQLGLTREQIFMVSEEQPTLGKSVAPQQERSLV